MNYPIGERVIIRTHATGVLYGTLADYDMATRSAKLYDSRRIWYWEGAASLSQMALEGVSLPEKCRFCMVVSEEYVNNVEEIIPCTVRACDSLDSVPVWKV